MDFKEFIQAGWGKHQKDPEGLAKELEENTALAESDEQVAGYIQLANHTIGEHLGDWRRASALGEKLMDGREASPDLLGGFTQLASAQYLAGKVPDALVNEAAAVRVTKMEKVSVVISIRAKVGSALVFNGKIGEGAKVFQAALELARAQDEKLACDLPLAAAGHNLANELMQREERSDAENALMVKAAEASKEFWLKCGNWTNEERADYLLALVHNKLGDADKALEYAARSLEVIKENGEEEVDEAFVNLAMAQSFKLKDNRDRYNEHIARADELAEAFPDQGLKDWYKEERAKVEWQ